MFRLSIFAWVAFPNIFCLDCIAISLTSINIYVSLLFLDGVGHLDGIPVLTFHPPLQNHLFLALEYVSGFLYYAFLVYGVLDLFLCIEYTVF